MAEEHYDCSAYAINEDGEYPQIPHDGHRQSTAFGYTPEDYTEQPLKINNITTNTTEIAKNPSMKIGPEFKLTKAGPQKTANTINVNEILFILGIY
jgi:hypothetical protein